MAQNSTYRNRRAVLACLGCRKKKIRCDIATLGAAPCTRCRITGDECRTAESRRGRHRRNAKNGPEIATEATDVNLESGSLEPSSAPGAVREVLSSSVNSNSCPLQRPDSTTDMNKIVLPGYIQPVPPECPAEDVAFLKLKGAFSCPPDGFRNALITSYISWVHPFCPIIDLHEFLSQIVHADGSCGQVSLLVLQAVMFAGMTFVPFEYIRDAGYKTRHDARDDFFSRVKLLYDFRYEADRVRTVQALLLMSYWQDKHDALQNHWYWIALANGVGRSISLNQEPAHQLSRSDVRLRRRLGWTCFVRDRILSVGLRQKPSLLLHDLSLRPLELSDFDIRPFPSDVLQVFGHCSILADIDSQNTLARLYMEKIQLCVILDRVFADLYTDQTLRTPGTSELTTALIERNGSEIETENPFISDLRQWMTSLPEECRYYPSSSPFLTPSDEIIRVHQAFLHMLYHTVHLAIFQPKLHQQQSQEVALRCVRLSSVAITQVAEDLYNYGILHLVQSAVVSMLVRAAVSHLYDYKTLAGEKDREQSLRRFHDNLSHLTRLTGIHKYAMFASTFLGYSAQKLGIANTAFAAFLPWEFGIWEDVHSPQRLLTGSTARDGSSSQTTSKMPAVASGAHPAGHERSQFGTEEVRTSGPSDMQADYVPVSDSVWDPLDDGAFVVDSASAESLDSWFRNCFWSFTDTGQ